MATILNSDMSNTAVLTELGSRIKQLRLSKNKDQQQCAFEAGISLRTLSRLENGHSVSLEAVLKVIRTLGLIERLDLLLPTIEISPVQQAKNKHKKPRRRASNRRNVSSTAQQPSKAKQLSEKKIWGGFTKPATFEPDSPDGTSE
jgi:transcriptional regulator with XRE-family HTH domain